MWLRDLPNGDMPNAHLRTELLRSMQRLPITKEALAACSKDRSLGVIVAKMRINPRETVQNRKIAQSLVQTWLKQVLVKQRGSLDLDALADGGGEEVQGKLE